MLIWLILVPVIAAACIGLLKTPGRLTVIGALGGLVISAIYMLRAFRRVFEGDIGLASERATGLSCADKWAAGFLAFFIAR